MFLEIQLRGAEAQEDTLPNLLLARRYTLASDEERSRVAALSWNQHLRDNIARLVGTSDGHESWHPLREQMAEFFTDLQWRVDADAIDSAEARGEQVILDVISDTPEITLLPWEGAPTEQALTYLSDFSNVLVRYAPSDMTAQAALDSPQHPGVLFAWSEAGGPVPHATLGETLRVTTANGGVALHELANADEVQLIAALKQEPLSVVHVQCRLAPDDTGASISLRLGSREAPVNVSIMRLARILGRHSSEIRLVVLDMCDDQVELPVLCHGLAEPLLRVGIPAVLCARAPRTLKGSKKLSRSLYQALLTDARSLEYAMRSARTTLLSSLGGGSSLARDGHGLQLHLRSRELVTDGEGNLEERPVLASYPFGTSPQPTPAHSAPRQDTEIKLSSNVKRAHKASKKIMKALERHSEDPSLSCRLRGAKGDPARLAINSSTDGAQRLLLAHQQGALQASIGLEILAIAPVVSAGRSAVGGPDGEDLGRELSRTDRSALQRLGVAVQRSGARMSTKAKSLVQFKNLLKLAVVVGIGVGTALASTTLQRLFLQESPTTTTAPAEPVSRTHDAGHASPPDARRRTHKSKSKRKSKSTPATGKPPATKVPAATPKPGADKPVATKHKIVSRRKKPRTTSIPDVPAKSEEPRLGRVHVGREALYDIEGKLARVTWRVPRGAKGVLVVKSRSARIGGMPANGNAYAAGAPWPGTSGASVVSTGRETKADFEMSPGDTIWLHFWAFDDAYQYGPRRPFEWTVPRDLDPTER